MLKGRKTLSALGLGSQQWYLHQLPAHPGSDLVLVTKHGKIVAADLILHIIPGGKAVLWEPALGKVSPASCAAPALADTNQFGAASAFAGGK